MNYRFLLTITALFTAFACLRAETASPDPIADRLIALCAASAVSPEDVAYLSGVAEAGGPSECLARAILFRHSASGYGDQFRRYFAIDRSIPVTALENQDINDRVNGVMKEFRGRPPAEVMSRIYLSMRGKGYAAHKADGTEMSLEVMFRASVFAAVNGGSQEKVLQFAAEADKK